MPKEGSSKKKLSTKNLWIFSLVLLILFSLFTFSLAEIATRLLRPKTPDPKEFARQSLEYAPSIFSRHVFPQKEQIIYTGSNEIRYYINKWGYRGHDFEIEKLQDTTRIIFMGGSQVFDQYSPRGQDWPHLIEKILMKKGLQVEVINAGTPGHSTFDSLGRLYSEIHWFHPDYVVISHEYNDIKYFKFVRPEYSMLRMFKPLSMNKNLFIEYTGFIDRILCKSQLYLKLRNRYYNKKLRPGGEGVITEENIVSELSPYGPIQYELNLNLLVDLIRDIGAVPILLIQPRLVSPDNSLKEKK